MKRLVVALAILAVAAACKKSEQQPAQGQMADSSKMMTSDSTHMMADSGKLMMGDTAKMRQ